MYYLRMFFENNIRDVEVLSNSIYKIGPNKNDQIKFPELPKEIQLLQIQITDEGFILIDKKNQLSKKVGNVNINLSFGTVVVIDKYQEIAITVYQTEEEKISSYELLKTEVIIGRDRSCDIVVLDKYVSKKHMRLLRYGDSWYFEDLNSENGVYVNNKLFKHLTVDENDKFSIGTTNFFIKDNTIVFDGGNLVFSNMTSSIVSSKVESLNDSYPYYFKPATRLKEDAPTDAVEIEKAPNIGSTPKISILSVLIPPLMMVGIIVAVCILTKGNITTILLSAPMALIGVVATVLRYNSEKRSFREKQKLRTSVYEDYLDAQIGRIEKLANIQRKSMNLDNPSTQFCMQSTKALTLLWDRKISDDDFMNLRVGSGTVPTSFKVNIPKLGLELNTDVYNEQIKKLKDTSSFVSNIPIVMNFHNHPNVGIIGDRKKSITLTKNLIYQAAFHHNYDELKIVVICDKNEMSDWSFVRWLPHNFDDSRSTRCYADNAVDASNLLDNIELILDERVSNLNDRKKMSENSNKPFYLIVCASQSIVSNHYISRKITQLDPQVNIGAIFVYDKLNNLPNNCYYICDVTSNPIIYEKDHASVKHNFEIDVVSDEDYEKYARYMAPVRTDTDNKIAGFPQNITFMQGMHASNFADLNVESKWAMPTPEQSMSVPIGVNNNQEVFNFDIHEKNMGPHGLVAGMTGSGKSETVQTFILSMAVKFPPNAVSFVLIDFKGTGLILPFRYLPHLAGTISDLDTNISRNLIALLSELERRKALLDKYKVNKIQDYLKLYREGKAEEPLSYMIIVIDEFAEFKKKFPDFMKAVSSIFRIGRTLGVHIILLTQKPSSVVDDEMNANTRFRWCLKVASSQDSNEMLHHPDAAKITNPGRAFIQVGEDEIYEQIQTFYSGGNYDPSRQVVSEDNRIALVDIYGNKEYIDNDKSEASVSMQTEIEYVVNSIKEFAVNNKYDTAKKIWSDKLPILLSLSDITNFSFNNSEWVKNDNLVNTLKPVVGLVDDPRKQEQFPFVIDFTEKGNYMVYGAPGTGKTSFLNTLLMSTAMMYTPEEVNMYIIDCGSGLFNIYRNMPHVGGVVGSDDKEKMEKLKKLLIDELEKRKQLFANAGLQTINAYKKAFNDPLPYIVLMIDNYANANQSFEDLTEFLLPYIRDGANYGLYFIGTVTTVNSMSYRLAENIKNKISLYMNDKSDYATILGGNPGMTIDMINGRGLCKLDKYAAEFHTALVTNDTEEFERVSRTKEIVTKMESSWTGKKAKQIPMLPAKVVYKDYPCDEILLGLSKETVDEIKTDLVKKQFMLISSFGTSNYISNVVNQVVEKYKPEKILLYGDIKDNANLNKLDVNGFEQELQNILPELNSRREEYLKNNTLDVNQYPYIFIAINNYNELVSQMKQESFELLSNLISLGTGLNLMIVIQDNSIDITKAITIDKTIMRMVEQGTVVLMGGTLADNHSYIKLNNIPFVEKSKTILLNDAYIISKNEVGEVVAVLTKLCVE